MDTPPTPPAPATLPADAVTPTSRVKQRLIGLNVALLLMLGVVTVLTSLDAGAQPGTSTATTPRPRGEYTVVAGRYQGGTTNVVWMLDAANQELLAFTWDRNRNEVDIIGHRKLSDDAQLKPGR